MPNIDNISVKQAMQHAKHLPWTISLVWKSVPGWCVAWLVLIVVRGLLPIALVYATREFVQRLEQYYGSSTGSLATAILPAIVLGVVLVASEVLASLANIVKEIQSNKLQDFISGLVHRQTSKLDLAFFENSDFYDELHRAVYESRYRPEMLIGNIGSLTQDAITLLSMGTILVPYSWWLPIALLISTIPAFWTVMAHGIRRHNWRRRITSVERESWYYDWLLTGREPAAELRLFQLAPRFRSRFNALRRNLRSQKLRLTLVESMASSVAGAVGLVFAGLVAIWAITNVDSLARAAPLASLAFFYQAFSQGQKMMRGLLQQAGELYSNNLYLGDLRRFVQLCPSIVSPERPSDVGTAAPAIRFENVAYTYTDQTAVFNDFNLEIPAGEFVALVGPNGAGKSTMLKLLCRLYDPSDGRITWNGVDLRQFSLDELRTQITVLFQDPMQYNATVRENIAFGRSNGIGNAGDLEAEIVRAAEEAGIDETIRSQRNGYEQLLGHWFAEGTELSDGEWLRIALARACFRRSPFIILDEPTSAMDPWAEARWTERFHHFAAGRTVLLITHRFTTARHADKICVMKNGQIIESGKHSDLIMLDGLYAQSWHDQVTSSCVGPALT